MVGSTQAVLNVAVTQLEEEPECHLVDLNNKKVQKKVNLILSDKNVFFSIV